jgi:peptidyl-prolyl cis-trans isomerase A (cyclophilin A)
MNYRTSLNAFLALCVMCLFTTGCAAQGLFPSTQTSSNSSENQTQQGSATTQQPAVGQAHPALANPALAKETAPEVFYARFETSKGDYVIKVNRAWSPAGADRFYNLMKIGYFKDIAIFRAVPGFMYQFGIHGDPAVSAKWSDANIKDDNPAAPKSNLPYTITFAKTGAPNSRSTQMFVNLGKNDFLDSQGFTPFGEVVEGKQVVDKINTQYGENKPADNVQGNFKRGGNAYIFNQFPNIDKIISVTEVQPPQVGR